MEFIREEIVNGRKTTYVRYTAEELAAMKEKAQQMAANKPKPNAN
jgi:hypothetical protein